MNELIVRKYIFLITLPAEQQKVWYNTLLENSELQIFEFSNEVGLKFESYKILNVDLNMAFMDKELNSY